MLLGSQRILMYTILVAPGLGATKDKHLPNIYWLNKSTFLHIPCFCCILCTIYLLLPPIWGTFTSKSYFLRRRLFLSSDALKGGKTVGAVSTWHAWTKAHRLCDSSHKWTNERAGTSTLVLPNALWGSPMATGHFLSLPALTKAMTSTENELPSSWIFFWFKKSWLKKYCIPMLRAALLTITKTVATTQVSINGCMNGQTKCGLYTHGMLFSLWKEGNPATCYNMDEPWGSHTKWK